MTTTQLGKGRKTVNTKLIRIIGQGMEIKRKKMRKKHMRNTKVKRKNMIRVKMKREMITEGKRKDRKGNSHKKEVQVSQM